MLGAVAQLGKRRVPNVKARGSIPICWFFASVDAEIYNKVLRQSSNVGMTLGMNSRAKIGVIPVPLADTKIRNAKSGEKPSELRKAQWHEFNLEAAEWRIPAERMKSRALHIVPLSRKAVAIVRDLHPLTGLSRYVFPIIRNNSRPMSNNTINAGLRRLGYAFCAYWLTIRGMV
jgi:integrase